MITKRFLAFLVVFTATYVLLVAWLFNYDLWLLAVIALCCVLGSLVGRYIAKRFIA